ncbi:hypothetical protein, partial [Thiorhodospira sibirica]|uniref:hypothetical protein n=1 Tax=Thiorhodospira sibirica TaxID=154347 RepID=UPI001C8DB907
LPQWHEIPTLRQSCDIPHGFSSTLFVFYDYFSINYKSGPLFALMLVKLSKPCDSGQHPYI